MRDLTARIRDGTTLVEQVVVGSRGRGQRLAVPWVAVAGVGPDGVTLKPGAPPSAPLPPGGPRLEPGELMLGRDVLDKQVLDLAGKRLSRVADVLLEERPDGRLEVLGVEVGTSAVVRRLGLRRLGELVPERAVAWSQLHLTSTRGHAAQLEVPSTAIHELDPQDVAELIAGLNVPHATSLLRRLEPRQASDALVRSRPGVGSRLVRALDTDEAEAIRAHLPPEARTTHPHLFPSASQLDDRRFRRLDGWRRDRPEPAEVSGEARVEDTSKDSSDDAGQGPS